LGQIHIQE